MKFPFKSLEDWIAFLESKGQIIRNSKEVELRNEISAISKKVSQTQGPAVLHNNILGYPGWHIFHDGLTTLERVAWSFGVQKENFLANVLDVLREAMDNHTFPEDGGNRSYTKIELLFIHFDAKSSFLSP